MNPAVQHHVLARLLPLPRRAGVMVIAGTQKDLVLKVPGDVSATRVDMKAVRQRLSTSMTNRKTDSTRTLFVAPSATPDVIAAALAGGFDLLTDDPELVIVGGEVLLQSEEPRRRSGSGRPAWSRIAVLRVSAFRRLQQSEPAAAISVSQQAISLALSRLSSTVARNENGWVTLDGALESSVRDYSGPGGTVSCMAWTIPQRK
ncbi:hypothetical protein [Nocardia niigatensis]